MAYLPQSWEMLENASRRYLDRGTLQVQAVEDGFALMLCAPAISQNNTVDFTTVASSEPLLDGPIPVVKRSGVVMPTAAMDAGVMTATIGPHPTPMFPAENRSTTA